MLSMSDIAKPVPLSSAVVVVLSVEAPGELAGEAFGDEPGEALADGLAELFAGEPALSGLPQPAMTETSTMTASRDAMTRYFMYKPPH